MHASTETIDCPLCLGVGSLKRSEVLDRLGVKDLARVAQLSAEEVFRLLQRKLSEDSQQVWARFETELARRTAELELHQKDELQSLSMQRETLSHRVEDYLREVGQLRERNQELEGQMERVSRIGKREEMDFADEARTWAGICVSEKLAKNGDFILAYRDPSGAPLEPRMLVDNKDKSAISEGDIDKLVRDARERSIPVAVLVARTEEQLRQVDRETRWSRKDGGIWVLRTTRQWFPRDLDVLKPLFEQMRVHGSDFLERNAALADEVRRTFADLDRIEGELRKATKAISSASGLVAKYRSRLQELCESAVAMRAPTGRDLPAARIV
ncbi:MAG: hypothetical protein ACLQBK_01295 [Candidatus Sulfotelmatobacter sp.]